MGEKVDYKPTEGGTWRVFYYDKTGEFGEADTLYLKRDSTQEIELYYKYARDGITEKGLEMMKKLNPTWKNYSTNASKTTLDTFQDNEKVAMALCDTNNWKTYAEGHPGITTKYAIGGAPIEMWTKAYNIYIEKYEPSDPIINCGMKDAIGYGWGLNNGSLLNGQFISIDITIPQSEVITKTSSRTYQWLASPSFDYNRALCTVGCEVASRGDTTTSHYFCPVVAL